MYVVFVTCVAFVSFGSVVSANAPEQPGAECTTAAQCREMTLAAISAQDLERAHDLAWRVFQTSPRGSLEAMALVARAQSLSGRGDDAFIMLQRLAAAGGIVEDVETSADFRRVREHPGWPQLRAAFAGDKGGTNAPGTAGAPAAPVAAVDEARSAPSAPAPAGPAAPAAAVSPASPLPSALALPTALSAPGAFAYDAVSARFILASAANDVLTVVSESSGNATTLVSAGWSGHSRITAVAINRRNGDMWITAHDDVTSALHRFQLVSGRLLQTIASPDEADRTQFTALAVTADALFILDAAGHRILVLAAGNTSLRAFAALPKTISPIGLTHSGAALFVSHASGLLRVDLGSRLARPVTNPPALDVSNLRSPAWYSGSLLAIQEHADGARVVRLRMNARGTSVTGLDVIGSASALAGTLAGDDYYFLGADPGDAGLSFQTVPARAPSP